jgi:hypothetical protein
MHEFFKVKGKRIGGHAHHLGKQRWGKPFIAFDNQGSKNPKAACLGQCSPRINYVLFFHNSIVMEIYELIMTKNERELAG